MRKHLVVLTVVGGLLFGGACTTSPSGEVTIDPAVQAQLGNAAVAGFAGLIAAILGAIFGNPLEGSDIGNWF
ncbi:MAG TPA: hypothetical protein VJM33_14545 [Microthrixaceae bacterium]|nr:hypothetical protein [Microthrixaceae bacterium]